MFSDINHMGGRRPAPTPWSRTGGSRPRLSLTPSPLGRMELVILTFLANLLLDRGRLLAMLRRLSFHHNAAGLDADPRVVDGLRHAIHAAALLLGTRPASDEHEAREKVGLFVDLPICGGTHVATALVACVEADRAALGMTLADLA